MTESTIRMTDVGTGKKVLILHGLLGAGRNWGNVVRDLSSDHHAYVVDLPNHGDSAWTASMDYPSQAQEIAQVIESIGAPITLIGHSMGGKIAMTLALTRSTLIEALVVVDIAPVTYTHDFGTFTRAMKAVPLAGMTKRSEVEAHLSESISDPRIRAFLMQNLDSTPDGFRWRPNLDLIERSQDDIMGFPDFPPGTAYHGPTLFISGALSDYVTPEYHAPTRALFPQAEFCQIADAGHWLHADQAQAFVAELRRFLGAH